MGLFDKPAPQQAVPGDLRQFRNAVIDALLGTGGGNRQTYLSDVFTGGGRGVFGSTQPLGALRPGGPQQMAAGGNPAGQTQGVLGDLLGLTSTPAPDLASLGTLFNRNLNDQITAMNASTPGRWSSANLWQQGQLRERSMQDFNVLASQIQQQGRSQQLAAIMALLGPVLGPSFGGPFTQGASPWENILGGAATVAQFGMPWGGGFAGLPVRPSL